MKEQPKDFIHFICSKCPDEIDEDPFPSGCACYATRDCTPTKCPCRGIPKWKIDYIVWKEGERNCPPTRTKL
jgi:hypothetical protein